MQEFFKSLGMDPSLAAALQKQGIETLTEVQKKVIPEALKNKELVVQSETGSGKTLAFLLPLFMKINPEKKEMQAVILAPTHELVMQILHQTELLAQNSGMKITAAPMIGNVNIERQIDKLKEKPHILVGTPGRVLELIRKKKISAYTIKTIVLDEADTLTGEKNIESISAIIKSTLRDRQLLMFSATITKQTEMRAAETDERARDDQDRGICENTGLHRALLFPDRRKRQAGSPSESDRHRKAGESPCLYRRAGGCRFLHEPPPLSWPSWRKAFTDIPRRRTGKGSWRISEPERHRC